MRVYTTEQLGPKRSLTREGFLVCYDVPIARTGVQVYGPDETPVPPGRDGLTRIMRDASEVFKKDSISSIIGKPVTNDHPEEDVTPANWRDLACGHVLDARRGSGELSDCLVGDIMITCPETIRDIEDGKREVSCGYDPTYDKLDSPDELQWQGRQRDIIYNHLALVDKGRCGPRCAIGDRRTVDHQRQKEPVMAKDTFIDRLRRSLAGRGVDTKTVDAALDSAVGDDDPTNPLSHHVEVHNHMNPAEPNVGDDLPARVANLETGMKSVGDAVKKMHDKMFSVGDDDPDEKAKKEKETKDAEEKAEKEKKETEDEAILGQLEMEAPPGTSDRARKARDSVYLSDSFQDTVAMAEIIVPGVRLPTFDQAAAPRKTFDEICKFRRTVLDLAYQQPATRQAIDGLLGGKELDTKKMTCDAARTLFRSVGALRKAENNGSARTADARTARATDTRISSIGDLNRVLDEKYRNKKAS